MNKEIQFTQSTLFLVSMFALGVYQIANMIISEYLVYVVGNAYQYFWW